VDFFQCVWAALAWMVTVTVLPIGIPMAALAFRVWRETRETDIEGSELWTRSFLAWAALAGIMVAFVAADWLLADQADLPPGLIHLVAFVGYLALVSYVLVYFFSLDDYFEGLSLAAIYVFVPIVVLFLLNGMLGFLNESLRFWDPLLGFAKYWLKNPSS
jgi:hypothetical protein